MPGKSLSGSLEHELRALPDLEVSPGASLAALTTLRIGGSADLLVRVASETSLVAVVEAALRHEQPLWLHGLGSNVLFPDGGMRGVVARLLGELASFRVQGERVIAGAGASLAQLARRTAQQDLIGLEALSGFPSSVGGAVVMNAGCYGTEIRDVLETTRVYFPQRGVRELTVSELEAGYRSTNLQHTDAVVLGATFRLQTGDGAASLARIGELNKKRWASLPSGKPNAGSVFRNPEGDYAGRLIEACGLKGALRGGAQISEKHANVIVNLKDASASDVLELLVLAHRAVREQFGIELEPELVLAGELRECFERALRGASPSPSASE